MVGFPKKEKSNMSFYPDDEEEDQRLNAIAGRVAGFYLFLVGLLIYKLFS